MSPEKWQAVKTIFSEISELPESSWAAALDGVAGLDGEVRREVERLLALHGSGESFLDSVPTFAEALRNGPREDAPVFAPGQQVAERFRIVRLCGRGGMGEVYAADDLHMNRLRVALKTARTGLAWSETVRERLRREVEMSRQVSHPNVCRVYDLFLHREADGGEIPLLSMELLEGDTLAERIQHDGPMAWPMAGALMRQMGEALSAAHEAGVVHRDFKSANVILVTGRDRELRAVVTDFGIAHAWQAELPPPAASGETLAAGTPAYMAPEQFLGQPASVASDIYAYGVVVWQLLTGSLPFANAPSAEAAVALRRQAPHIEERKDLPPQVRRMIERCLAADPGGRFPSIAAALGTLDDNGGATRRGLAGLLLAAAGAGAIWQFRAQLGFGGLLFRPGVTIAVVPFENRSGNPSLDVAGVGIADDVIRILAQSSQIRVLARGTSFRMQQAAAAPAPAVKPDMLLRGQIHERAGGLTIDFQIVDPASRVAMWSRSIERTRAQLSQVAADVSRIVAAAFDGGSREADALGAATPHSSDPDAFNWYLLGRRFGQERKADSLMRALECFDKAIARDPRYALAWCEKAAAQLVLAGNPDYPVQRWLPEAEKSALRALELDGDLAEAHLALGSVEQRYRWRWNEALWRYRRAVERKPGLAVAHHWLAGLLSNLAQHDEAVREIVAARQLDPLSMPMVNAHCGILVRAGRYAEAIPEIEAVLTREPDLDSAHIFRGQVLAMQGKLEEAEECLRAVLERKPRSASLKAQLAYVVGRRGRRQESAELAEELERRWSKEQFLPYFVVQAHAGNADEARMSRWLETAWSWRDPTLVLLKVDPLMRAVHGKEFYLEMLRRMRLV